jgi:TIR domain-containing protein
MSRPVNFYAHVVRTNELGASRDFEQMLALLVQRVEGGNVNLVWGNSGDRGIDLLAGDLNGRLRFWQAKYFIRGVGRAERRLIESSLVGAINASMRHGFQVEQWTLCVPSSMDAHTSRWWQDWRSQKQNEFRVRISLWDETVLRGLLIRPEADDIRRHYYDIEGVRLDANQTESHTDPPERRLVFLCHSSSDKSKVRDLYKRLRADGFQPWLDEEDLLPGKVLDPEIRKTIRQSKSVIVCLSRTSIVKVGYVQKEISYVLDAADEQPEGAIYLIPARLEPCEMPERLRRLHGVDLFEDGGYDRLTRSLRA